MISDLSRRIFHNHKDLKVFENQMKEVLIDWELQNKNARNNLNDAINGYENNLNM